MPDEWEAKQRQLEAAQKTLNELEVQAAGIPPLERPPTFSVNLQEMRDQVRDLKAQVAELKNAGPAGLAPILLPFINREEELAQILSAYAPPYYLLDAPARYGKTELLKQLRRRFVEQNWYCAYVAFDRNTELPTLASEIAGDLNLTALLDSIPPSPRPGRRLAAALGKNWDQAPKEGVAFLIDLTDRPSAERFGELVQTFIADIKDSLVAKTVFAQKQNRFRVIMAGGHVAELPSNFSKVPITPRALSTFSPKVILDSARAYVPECAEPAIQQLSAHLFYLTGGHPGCIAQILGLYKSMGAIDPVFFLQDCGPQITPIVQGAARRICEGLQERASELCGVLEKLSVFRYLDYGILKNLIASQEIGVSHNEFDLADKLVAIYFLSWNGRFLHDGITRRLLAIHNWQIDPESFKRQCQNAVEMCLAQLKTTGVQLPERWAVEALFQTLQAQAPQIQDAAQRAALSQQFWDTTLDEVLHAFVREERVPPGNRRGEKEALLQAMQDPWEEFRFTVNYYLRADDYTDAPYQQLLARINTFFAA